MVEINKMWKVAITIFIVNALENLILLYFFGVAITQQTLIGVGIFTLVLFLILKQLNLLRE